MLPFPAWPPSIELFCPTIYRPLIIVGGWFRSRICRSRPIVNHLPTMAICDSRLAALTKRERNREDIEYESEARPFRIVGPEE